MEYILLVSVMIFMSVAFFKKVEEHLLTNPDSMINRYLGAYRGTMGGGINGSYKTFRIPR